MRFAGENPARDPARRPARLRPRAAAARTRPVPAVVCSPAPRRHADARPGSRPGRSDADAAGQQPGQPQVYVHRDYHSRNLMVLDGGANPGILDFQDAVIGPITYDAVSLWRDAYIEWDEQEQLDWLIRYWERARKAGLPVAADFGEFYRDFEWMGLQRHLKVLGIFARLYHRDGKDGYLANLPLVLKYARQVAGRYIELRKLVRLFDALDGVERPVGYTF
ncbi:aminoglycoside phosphotransferase family protein [Cupriavidus basilensis]